MGTKTNVEGGRISDATWAHGLRLGNTVISGTGSGTIATLSALHSPMLNVDPNGGAGNLLLPLATLKSSKGLVFFITNTADAAEAITLQTSAGSNLSPSIDIAQNESAIVWCDGAVWKGGVLKNT